MTVYDHLMSLRDQQRAAKAVAEVVVRGDAIPWEESPQGKVKWYLHPLRDDSPSAYTMYVQELASGSQGGKQLSQGGTLFYLLDGELLTTVDDEVYRWQAGDLLTLPIMRDGVVHQHMNVGEKGPAVVLALETNTAGALGLDKGCGLELLESAGPIVAVPGEDRGPSELRKDASSITASPVIDSDIDIQYHRDIERWRWIRNRHERGRLLIPGHAMPWEQNIQGRVKYYLNPEFRQNAMHDWTFFLHDIKTHTGSHRHQGGILIFVVDGEGYTLVDGVRSDWSTGDLIMLPIKPGGVEHEHHNLNEGANCHWIASFYWPWWELIASEFTQIRAHPDYQPVATKLG